MEENHKKFLTHLRASHNPVWVMARRIWSCGFEVRIRPTEEAPEHKQWEQFADSGDLRVIVRGKEERFEVKQRFVNFTKATDWPYPTFIVCAKHAYDEADPTPTWFFYVNNDMTHFACFETEKKRDIWTTDTFRDGRYDGVVQECYVMPPDQLSYRRL